MRKLNKNNVTKFYITISILFIPVLIVTIINYILELDIDTFDFVTLSIVATLLYNIDKFSEINFFGLKATIDKVKKHLEEMQKIVYPIYKNNLSSFITVTKKNLDDLGDVITFRKTAREINDCLNLNDNEFENLYRKSGKLIGLYILIKLKIDYNDYSKIDEKDPYFKVFQQLRRLAIPHGKTVFWKLVNEELPTINQIYTIFNEHGISKEDIRKDVKYFLNTYEELYNEHKLNNRIL